MSCEWQHLIVVDRPSAATSSGIGCLATGGRCNPGTLSECPPGGLPASPRAATEQAIAEAFKRMAPDDYKPMPDRPVPMESAVNNPIPEAVRHWLDEWCEDHGVELPADAYNELLESITSAQMQEQAVDRDRTLTAARFRAACYALKEAVEGPTGEVWRSESGSRLKDRPEWVAFYNLVSDMHERGGPDPYASDIAGQGDDRA